jgi:hypothetical protein
MKKLVFLSLIAALILSGCNSSSTGNGELIGVQKREKWFEPDPFGMVKVAMGSFVVGPNDEDPTFAMNSQSKTISVDAFWMDETEITNNEYRQFVHWVIDSLTRKTLGEQFPDEYLISEDKNQNPIDPPFINWDTKIDTRDADVLTALEAMYIPENERFFRRKELDTRKLVYTYQNINYQEAAKEKRNYKRSIDNSDNSLNLTRSTSIRIPFAGFPILVTATMIRWPKCISGIPDSMIIRLLALPGNKHRLSASGGHNCTTTFLSREKAVPLSKITGYPPNMNGNMLRAEAVTSPCIPGAAPIRVMIKDASWPISSLCAEIMWMTVSSNHLRSALSNLMISISTICRGTLLSGPFQHLMKLHTVLRMI